MNEEKYKFNEDFIQHSHSKPNFDAESEIEKKNRRTLVHQTSPEAAMSILTSKKFIPTQRWDWIPSIYFSETAPDTDIQAQNFGTYLIADVYLGQYIANDTNFFEISNNTNGETNVTAIRNSKGNFNEGLEYVIKDPNRILNIRYLDGIKPDDNSFEMHDCMPLIYMTNPQEAAKIIETQKIPVENRNDIAGSGYYFWDNIPDARKYKINSTNESETFIIADVHFPSCFELDRLPDQNDIQKYQTFRGKYQDTHYYMVKSDDCIEHIRYISGAFPDEDY